MIGIKELQSTALFTASLRDTRQAVDTQYYSALNNKLSTRRFAYTDPGKLAWELLRNGEYIDTNAAVETCKEVNELVHEYKNLYDRRILLAGFPSMNTVSEEGAGPTRRAFRLDLGTDMLSRAQQNENCYRAILDSSNPDLKQDYKNELYHDYETFRKSAEDFLKCDAANSKEAAIVLNGHGSTDGLEFNHGRIVSWNELIHDLSDLVTRRPVQGRHVPYRIHLVIGACYAHCGTYRPSDKDVIVKTFTGPGYEETISRLRFQDNGRLVDANSVPLNGWATEFGKDRVSPAAFGVQATDLSPSSVGEGTSSRGRNPSMPGPTLQKKGSRENLLPDREMTDYGTGEVLRKPRRKRARCKLVCCCQCRAEDSDDLGDSVDDATNLI